MRYDHAREFLLGKLSSELPRFLTYHNVQHTVDVINQAGLLSRQDSLSEEDITLLLTAALFHDSGYLESSKGHEEISCSLARTFLPEFDYTNGQIDRICELILATKMPHNPPDKLSAILCDADLSYLGTDSYQVKAEHLYEEMYAAALVHGRTESLHLQVKFLRAHHYFTSLAQKQFDAGVHKNLVKVQEELQANKSVTGHKEFHLSDFLLILSGVIIAGFALKNFLVPNKFFDGGVTGISLLVSELSNAPLSYVILAANLPFLVMGLYTAGRRFALKSLAAILMLGICLISLPERPITHDLLLVSIFGGFFLGIGIGLTMRAGCAVDGIEILALYTWRRTSFTISEIIMALNIIIFSVAGFHFGADKAFYSILTYFTASKTIDWVIEGIEAYTGVTIISGKSEMIKERLVNELGRGITIYKGERGYLPGKYEIHDECDIIFTVITRLELRKLKNVVNAIDPKAFVFANTIREASGGILKRRHIH
jgi:uncharacterized membrane-anchored protein YitT (DUF2179 family)/predicted metal-dependent HD superfamily phosphohydrolase